MCITEGTPPRKDTIPAGDSSNIRNKETQEKRHIKTCLKTLYFKCMVTEKFCPPPEGTKIKSKILVTYNLGKMLLHEF